MKFTVGKTRALQSLRNKPAEDLIFMTTPNRHKAKKDEKAGIGAVDFLPISLPAVTTTIPLPWTSPATLSLTSHPILQLHQEILDFAAFTSPTQSLVVIRKSLTSELIAVLQGLCPGLSLSSYGSTQTGLSLGSSDLDLRIVLPNSEADSAILQKISDYLSLNGYLSVYIGNAKVPIVRIERESRPKRVEISQTPAESPWIYNEIAQKPEIRPLILVLKAYFRQRNLNDTYTGGIGSYLLYHLVAFAVATHPAYCEDEANYERYSLGHYLLHFLRLYGEEIDFTVLAIDPAANRTIRRSESSCRSTAPLLLISPEDPSSNLASEGLRLGSVRKAMRETYALLCEQGYCALRMTPLRCFINPQEEI